MDRGVSPTHSSNSNDAPTLAHTEASGPPEIGQSDCPPLIPADVDEAGPLTAHGLFCAFLAKIHVVEMLPERSTVCTFDASLPIYEMISTLVAVSHRPLEAWLSDKASEAEARRKVEPVAASLASNVLAEICEFSEEKSELREENEDGNSPQRRSWTGPNDGWGCHPKIEGETMGWLQMPFTVQELAEFLAYSSSECEDGSMLDWDLSRWRKLKEESQGADAYGEEQILSRHGSLLTELPSPSSAKDREGSWPSTLSTLVQRAGGAPPRPMLRIDEPESTFLRAVELLLMHPELNALPVVSMIQRTVVAHLTLAACMAMLVQQFRGKSVEPLGELMLPDTPQDFVLWKDTREALIAGEELDGDCVVLHADNDSLRDLLDFFAQTNYTAAPVVTDGNVLVGVLGRRNLLQFLDLCMESCAIVKRDDPDQGQTSEVDQREPTPKDKAEAPQPEELYFDISLSLRQVIRTLEQHLPEDRPKYFGCGTTTKTLPLKNLLCEILLSDNHKVALIDMEGENAIIRRLIHVDEVMKFLIYGDSEVQHTLTLLEEM